MLNTLSQWFVQAPRRLVQGGLGMFFAGALALLLGAVAQLGGTRAAWADGLAFVPQTAAGYTAAAMLVAWGVWAMGSGLRLARQHRRT